jgi:hypothetical protein
MMLIWFHFIFASHWMLILDLSILPQLRPTRITPYILDPLF